MKSVPRDALRKSTSRSMKEVDTRRRVKRIDYKVLERGRYSGKNQKNRPQRAGNRPILGEESKESTTKCMKEVDTRRRVKRIDYKERVIGRFSEKNQKNRLQRAG